LAVLRDWLAAKLGVITREYHNNFVPQYKILFVRLKPVILPNRVMQRMGASGVTIGGLVLVRNDAWNGHMRRAPTDFFTQFEKHEMAHHWQVIQCHGVLFHVLRYFGVGLWIYLFQWDKHPYYDHPMETEARHLASQPPVDWRVRGKNRWCPWCL
jgi:hypothetical protein